MKSNLGVSPKNRTAAESVWQSVTDKKNEFKRQADALHPHSSSMFYSFPNVCNRSVVPQPGAQESDMDW